MQRSATPTFLSLWCTIRFSALFLLLSALFSTSEGASIGRRRRHASIADALSGAPPSESLPVPRSGGSSLADVFPVGRGVRSWTTIQGVDGAVPLSDETFRPIKNMNELSHKIVTSPGPNPKQALEASYAKGSWALNNGAPGGFSFYASGPADVDLTTAKEATFGYSVMFEQGMDWSLGGKLPGFYGGLNDLVAVECSGGRRDPSCWSARLMWRPEGQGEMYNYLPPNATANRVQCNVPPFSTCNPTYGASVGRGSFSFEAGQWMTVTQRIRLNTPQKTDGELEIFVNGESKVQVSGLVFRSCDSNRIRGIQMQTFFGGHSYKWASPKDQTAYFSDFSVAIIEEF
ncbi:hypothetical protein BC826DRAFT_1186894 [Russula brevipes]|nr:hypothetical protein BC826DRAFT_1186894 [Russula brevipes]